MALVLYTGADELFMSIRKSVLEQAGNDVTTVTGEQEMVAACSKQALRLRQSVKRPIRTRNFESCASFGSTARKRRFWNCSDRPMRLGFRSCTRLATISRQLARSSQEIRL